VGVNTFISIIGIIVAIVEPAFRGEKIIINEGYFYALIAGVASIFSTFLGKVGRYRYTS